MDVPERRPTPRKTGTGSLGKVVHFNRKAFGMQPAVDGDPRRPSYQDNLGSPGGPAPGLVAQDSSYDSRSAAKLVDGVGVTHGGDEAAGGGGNRAPASSAALSNAAAEGDLKRGVSPGVGGTTYVGGVGASAAVAADGGEGRGGGGGKVPRNVSMEESGGTNPLYKTVAPLTTSGGSQAVSERGRVGVFGSWCCPVRFFVHPSPSFRVDPCFCFFSSCFEKRDETSHRALKSHARRPRRHSIAQPHTAEPRTAIRIRIPIPIPIPVPVPFFFQHVTACGLYSPRSLTRWVRNTTHRHALHSGRQTNTHTYYTGQAETPGRSRLSTFLGNATPSRLRRLAGRMSTKSPGPSGSSQRSSSRHSRSGSSTRSRKHRRQGTFPGAYSQRNSSELDHQRPPADPVYTFMIKVCIDAGGV